MTTYDRVKFIQTSASCLSEHNQKLFEQILFFLEALDEFNPDLQSLAMVITLNPLPTNDRYKRCNGIGLNVPSQLIQDVLMLAAQLDPKVVEKEFKKFISQFAGKTEMNH
jgi:hypothetical protein